MPMQSHTGWSGVPWAFCDCHQKQWPVSQLRRQDGLLVCQQGYDNPMRTRSIDRRQSVIAQVLSNGEPEPALADILRQTQDNTSNF